MHSRLDGCTLQLLGREQSFEWTPKGEGLNPERWTFNRIVVKGKKKARREKREMRGVELVMRRELEKKDGWKGEGDLPFSGTIRRQILVFLF